MKVARVLVKQLTAVGILLVATAIGAGRAGAQGSEIGPGNPTILNAVTNLQDAVSKLQSSVDALIAVEESNVRFTPFVSDLSFDSYFCLATNVSAVSRDIRIQLIDVGGAGGPVVRTDVTRTVPAGAGGVGVPFESCTNCYCRFTVIGGSRRDIRAVMEVSHQGTARIVVPAE
jgi:hypothetical protein